MNPIFMSRADAIRTVLRAQDAASGKKSGRGRIQIGQRDSNKA
ncbi:hypothetical protein [Paraburkholderia unamae]|uniref:Uncharacterized protein n=1 Tax=Paraburkholderia unamae TaxID=219649 RepID=A0ABX5KXN5_9BURK|nr:hypothetical protein [Paraburkholderia unamae]PVX85562.1 hypothetical protein C7402_103139 [Paraburkholderia unamae]RAR55229.1 hypothetical protein C7401_1224 [Paraburkholderia unamae]